MRNKPNGPNGLPESAVPKQAGGAPGVLPAGDRVLPMQARTVANLRDGRGPGPRPKRYRVINGGKYMSGSVQVTLRAGKEIADNQYDVAMLRRVGIRLEELVDETAVAAAPVPAEAPPTPAE